MNKAFLVLLLFLSFNTFAGTPYQGKGGKVKDLGSGVYFTLKPGTGHIKCNDSFGLEAVTIKFTHPDVSQLEIYLYTPDGQYINLYYYNKTGKNFDSTIFSDTGTININMAKASFRGNYKPYSSLLKYANNGVYADTNWKLYIVDKYSPAGKGTLNYWYLTFGTKPASDVKLTSSNLPILNINTKKQSIYAGGLTSVYFDIIDNGPGKRNYLKDSLKHRINAGMGIRGASSSSFPKKGYNVETRDAKGNELDTTLLGLPKEHDWALQANYSDKTLLHNYLAYKLSRGLGQHAPRTKMCEVVINGIYQGVFLLVEKIKIDKNRVPISKLGVNDTSGDALTGGYICKIDWQHGSTIGGWYSKVLASCHPSNEQIYIQYDAPSTINTKQENYIHAYTDTFETAVNASYYQDTATGWRKYADENSFIDYFIVDELSKNVDGYRLSTYYYKDRRSINGGKIHMGPVWDFDLSFNNANYGSADDPTGWEYSYYCNWIPSWWKQMMKDTTWKNNLKCRWGRLRKYGFLRDSALLGTIDSMTSYLDESQKRNFNEWNILGVYVWPNSSWPATYQKTVDTMKYWIKKRTAWMDKNIKGTCRIDYDPPIVKLNWKDTVYLEVYNNYVDSFITYSDARDGQNVIISINKNLDTAHIGTYYCNYTVSDQRGNKTSVKRTIIVIDTLAPQIAFKSDTATVEVYTAYNDSDVIIKDNYDTLPLVTKSGTFTFKNNIPTKLGYYSLQYIASDGSGNVSNANRTIKVIDTIAPSIQLVGSGMISIFRNSNYTDSGYIVSDNYDKNVLIDTGGSFTDTKTSGTYSIVYTAIDQSGNKTSISRQVDVSTTVGIGKESSNASIEISPNPTNGIFSIAFTDGSGEMMKTEVFNSLGESIPSMSAHGSMNGIYKITFPSGAADGIYYIRVQYNDISEVRKLILLR